jgi:hypothetical protein
MQLGMNKQRGARSLVALASQHFTECCGEHNVQGLGAGREQTALEGNEERSTAPNFREVFVEGRQEGRLALATHLDLPPRELFQPTGTGPPRCIIQARN